MYVDGELLREKVFFKKIGLLKLWSFYTSSFFPPLFILGDFSIPKILGVRHVFIMQNLIFGVFLGVDLPVGAIFL